MPPSVPAAHQPWFLGAPVTKLITIGLILVSVMLHSGKNKSHAPTLLGRDNYDFRWSRLISSKLIFESTGELVLGTLALAMQSRRFEREFGSRKFFLLLLFTNIVSVVLEVTVMLTLDTVDMEYSGPYPWLGGMLFLYAKYTPRLHPRFFSILGFGFSEKSLYYLLCLYVIFYQFPYTLFPTVSGMIGAFLFAQVSVDVPNYLANVLPWERLFSVLLDPSVRVYAPLLQAQQVRRATDQLMNNFQQRRTAAGIGRGRTGGAAANPAAAAPPTPLPAPSDEAIEQLTAMGFDRQRVLEALQSSNNSVERAADRLLSGS